jgi:hypothetical protein
MKSLKMLNKQRLLILGTTKVLPASFYSLLCLPGQSMFFLKMKNEAETHFDTAWYAHFGPVVVIID